MQKLFNFLSVLLISIISIYANHDDRFELLNLDSRTIEFLNTHPVIKIANNIECAPYDYQDENRDPSGISIEIIRIISDILGFRIEWVNGYTWNKLLDMGKNGLVDIYPDISKTDEREKYITYSKPIIKVNFGILTLKNRYHDGNFFNLDNLNVGYINGKTYINEILQSFNNVTEIELDNIAEVTRALTNKTIDVYIDDITVLAENFSTDTDSYMTIKPIFKNSQEVYSDHLYIGVSKEMDFLVEAINQSIKFIYEEEFQSILNKYYLYNANKPQINLALNSPPFSREEIHWLLNHKVVEIYIPSNLPPISYFENGKPMGITSSYISELEYILGIKFVYNTTKESMPDGLSLLSRNIVSIIPGISSSNERKKMGIVFGKEFIELPISIYGNINNGYVKNINLLNSESTILTIEGHAINEWLRNDYPDIKIIQVKNSEEALKTVNTNKEMLFIGDNSTTNRELARNFFSNVLLVGSTPYSYKLGMAYSNKEKTLQNIVEKVVPEIKNSRGNFIESYWAGQKVSTKLSPTLFWIIVILVLIAAFIIFLQAYIFRVKHKLLEQHAITDPLTGLNNRRLLEQIYQSEKRRAQRENLYFVFMMFDIDHFKKFNDTYGHGTGDTALIEAAKSFKLIFKRGGDHVFRIGGEEFGVLTTVNDRDSAFNLANKLRKYIYNLRIPHIKNYPFKILTISGGISVIKGDDPMSFEQHFNNADVQLYKAKKSGRNIIL